MKAWFLQQSKVVRCILLIIPFVGWVVELLLRWFDFFEDNVRSPSKLLLAILAIFFGWFFCFIDFFWTIFFDNIISIDIK